MKGELDVKKRIVVIGIFVLLIVLVTVSATLSADQGTAVKARCSIQGSWVSSFTGPWDTALIMQETIIPLDPAGKKLAYTMHLVNPDATFGFPFEPFSETDYVSDMVGEAVKKGKNSYEFSLIGYGVKEVEANRGEIIYIWTVTGTMTCVDGENKTDLVNLAVYFGSQDADSDGYPDEGEEPFFCTEAGPLAVGKRVPQMPACVPSPMEE